ncbi:MAG: ABC transporter permease [Acidiferrobacteraceae bacterium]|jgi:simple sugar transport system permease protein|nr:ABC transporter permease [Acidiferrobacteraceae bacterium]MBT3768526.1 ABC transporter permease [Acidiferrobacteraceae bacterium]MBT5345417.1 ABC transporter permease [Acidiferrobacteraceae bacterium]MBT5623396.1 ABC transporter permease [Acidiferrobacteraceae bacterium]MBT6787692.1 ABC transporter permease [Acidiferrobacteraceae bacterium]
MNELLIASMMTMMTAATPLVFAATGELVCEKSGVLNLGVEGMMLIGAVFGFAAVTLTGQPLAGLLAGSLCGLVAALIFALLTLTLLSNQVATGLALTIFGTGLSALVGLDYVGETIEQIRSIHIPVLSDLPVIGRLLFGHDPLVYLAIIILALCGWFLKHTRWGMILRAVGDSDVSAHAIGYPVIAIRYAAVAFGGAMAGLGGAYLSLVYTPLWAENMTAGRGWIALALVVFASWRPSRVLLGAILFGGITILQLNAQAAGLGIPGAFMSMLPYIATIVVLVLISRDAIRIRLNAPACLGKPFRAER